ncbi:hypothetical protein [Methylobacterium sp. ID0610]|uniref:hypothetical protein n=1 Tax=Methylobacterium carpenticola TaxID=3344827 RepID=UPI00368C4CEA
MRALSLRWPILRAVIAVAALYALALQAVAGGALAIATASPAHVLCAPTDAPGGPETPHPVHLSCCTAAHALDGAIPPLPASTLVAWPRRPALALAWRPERAALPRAPPRTEASPRAPPVA